MKFVRAVLLTSAVAMSVAPHRADAGAAEASCLKDGRVLIESVDHAVLRYPDIWDFEIRRVSLGGQSVDYSLSMNGDLERYVVNQVPNQGDILEFEFRQLRNNSDGGNSFWSEWTLTRFEPPRCLSTPPPSTTTVITTTTDLPTTTTDAPTTTTEVPPSTQPGAPTTSVGSLITVVSLPARPNEPGPGPDPAPVPDEPKTSTLPFTGTPNHAMFVAAVFCVALGATAMVLRMRDASERATA